MKALTALACIGSGNKHLLPLICPCITRQRKKGEFLGFFPRNIWELSVILAQFQINS